MAVLETLPQTTHTALDSKTARRLVALLDHTALDDEKSKEAAEKVIAEAKGVPETLGRVAAVCVWPQFIALAKNELQGTGIRVATVVNFHHGRGSLETVKDETRNAIIKGADEIDVVIPFAEWRDGNKKPTKALVTCCREVCGGRILLKTILETGELEDPDIIKNVSRAVIQHGADFIKTSTGKRKPGATLEAARAILEIIEEHRERGGRIIGFKASGGIRTMAEGAEYLGLADNILGRDWAGPETFRIGASSLLRDVLRVHGNSV